VKENPFEEKQQGMTRTMASPVVDPRKKIISCISSELKRSQSMKGGSALVTKATREFIFEHGRKGGLNTRDLYGVDYYRWITRQAKNPTGLAKRNITKATDLHRDGAEYH